MNDEEKVNALSLFNDENKNEEIKKVSPMNAENIDEYRRYLLSQYRKKHKGILDKVKGGSAKSADDMMNLIVQDLLQQSETFFGNSLIFTEQGNLKDATTISIKRTDLLKMVADILAKKRQLNQKDADVDLNSPAFMIFQKICFDKMMIALKQIGLQNEMIRIILNKWGQLMKDWGKELKKELSELK